MPDSLIARDVEEVGRVVREERAREIEALQTKLAALQDFDASRKARRTIDPALIDRIFAAIKGYVDRRVKSAEALPDSSRVDKLEQKLSAITKDLAALRRDLGRGG